jgi:hypothetical protein
MDADLIGPVAGSQAGLLPRRGGALSFGASAFTGGFGLRDRNNALNS